MRTKNLPLLITTVAVAAIALLGCSSDDEDEGTDGTSSTTASTTTPDGQGAPIKVDASDLGAEERVTMEPGGMMEITTDGVTEVSTSDDTVLKAIQPGEDETLGDKAGAEAIVAGDAVLTLFDKDGKELYEVEVTVE
jgi:hypothetical protein